MRNDENALNELKMVMRHYQDDLNFVMESIDMEINNCEMLGTDDTLYQHERAYHKGQLAMVEEVLILTEQMERGIR